MKRKLFALALITIMAVMVSANFFAQAQNQDSTQTLLTLTKETRNQLDDLINQISANETTLQKIENYGLLISFEGNVSLYAQGVENLTRAEAQFASGDYNGAQASLIQALSNFKTVNKSMNSILGICNPQPANEADAQGLLEANVRARERISWLKTVVASNETSTLELLNQAENCFNIYSLNQLATQEQITQALANMEQGNALLSQTYQNLKMQGEALDSWRLNNYCNNLIAMVQERFQYGHSQGVDVNGFLQSMGYKNESAYIAELQHRIQEAINQPGDFQNKLANLNDLNSLIQNTDQALNQEIIHQGGTTTHAPEATGGSGSNSPSPSSSSPAPTGGNNSNGGSDSGSGQDNGNGAKGGK
ncbi:MAG: hypothetical protein ACQCN5_04595 [Candidatus Bathyarchaeia archaeon]|jgi:uncharacterized membrane protein YgcG